MNIAIVIATCNAHRDREQAILDTWGDSDIPILFDYCPPDDYLHLPEKMKKMFTRRIDTALFDYVFKTDTDTYLNVERLLSSGFEQHDYSGYTRQEWNPTYCYGPGYWVSEKAMNILADTDWNEHRHPLYPDAEDVMVGMVLTSHGIIPHHDDRYSHFTPVLKENTQILQHLSSRRQFKIEDMYEAHRRFLE